MRRTRTHNIYIQQTFKCIRVEKEKPPLYYKKKQKKQKKSLSLSLCIHRIVPVEPTSHPTCRRHIHTKSYFYLSPLRKNKEGETTFVGIFCMYPHSNRRGQ